MYRWRAFLLRRFGAKIGRHCIIRRSVRVEVPWHFSMGDYSTLGDECIVYSLGRITLGDRVTISQYSYICAGTHDHTRPDFPLLRPPIVIEDDVWIAADVFVGPDVRIGRGALIGARSSVFKDLPSWKVCVGNPAKPIKDRQYHGPRGPAEGPTKPRLVV
jgi:putative colanic acid biosynthesis acetyltransferase WcaF